jgi:hypothetical protein
MTQGTAGHPFLRRAPLIFLLAAGAFLWRSGIFPQPRTFLWELPASVEMRRAEVQLWKGSSLVARAEWLKSPQSPLVQKLELRQATYRALTFLEFADGRTEQHSQEVRLESEETLHLWLRPR